MTDSLLILITCRELDLRGGSQLYTRDLAIRLKELGHRPIIFTPLAGDLAAEVRSRGIAVVRNLDQIAERPDVIHAQHHLETVAASLHFPDVPVIHVCHGWLPWQEAPPLLPSIERYVAVDDTRRDRLVLEHGIDPAKVVVLPNFVDTDRFQPRSPLPARPQRALLFSNQATSTNFGAAVKSACETRGIALDIVGHANGNATRCPEKILDEYDLVFGRGRSAMEAMAVGAAVVLCDVEGVGPFVDLESFDALRSRNFGLAALTVPFDAAFLAAQIDRYSPAQATLVQQRVRGECSLVRAVDQLVEMYRVAVARQRQPDDAAMLAAAARYLAWLGPVTEEAVVEGVLDRRALAAAAVEESRLLRAEAAAATAAAAVTGESAAREIASLREDVRALRALIELRDRNVPPQANDKSNDLQAALLELQSRNHMLNAELELHRLLLEEKTAKLNALERSPFSRLRARLLEFPMLVRTYRMLRRVK